MGRVEWRYALNHKGGSVVVLNELYDVLIKKMGNNDVDDIICPKDIQEIEMEELTQKTDQEIQDFLINKEVKADSRERLFTIIQKLKIEQSIKDINDEVVEAEANLIKNSISELFEEIATPDDILVSEDEICIKYKLNYDSKLKNKINEKEKWTRDNVIDTISSSLGISTDNIILVENLSGYIDFISGFDENKYVSRGQKNCKYYLKPSLHRIYNNDCKLHMAQYESAFKQRIIYYDDNIDKKNEEELRAYGQHYGLPTNYLDFTEAHLISLLFAVEEFEYVENHAIVYFVDALSYNRDTVKHEKKLIDFSNEDIKNTLQNEYSDKSFFIRVGNCNERIHFQKGCFLKVEQNDSLEKMIKDYTKIAIIDKDSKRNILRELFMLGITFENIYPDKDNMVKTIKFLNEHM